VSALYPRVVGEGWSTLPDIVRHVHGGRADIRVAGSLAIRADPSRLARVLARLVRLPRRGERVPTVLQVEPDARGETWVRRFGDDRLVTRQWDEDGLLVERIGVVLLVFSVAVSDGALVFRQIAAGLGFGRCRLPLPRLLAPVVSARCWAAHEGLGLRVEVTHAVGLLCCYEGVLRKEPA